VVNYLPTAAVLPRYPGGTQDETLACESIRDPIRSIVAQADFHKLAVFGNMYGMTNMILFLFLVNFIASLMGVQLLRGYMPADSTINFGNIYNAFLGMYQIFTAENWSTLLFAAAIASQPVRQSVVVILFMTGWILFANCTCPHSIECFLRLIVSTPAVIVMQMFIAVINENFDIADEAKKGRQASHYWASQRQENAHTSWMKKLNPYHWFAPAPKAIAVDNLPSSLILPMQKALVQDYNVPKRELSAKVYPI
jgi:hypothetical protein